MLHQLEKEEDPLKVLLIYAKFWVQLYDEFFFSEAIGRQMGGFYRHIFRVRWVNARKGDADLSSC